MVCGFLAGLGLCLIADHNENHHGTGAPSTLINTAQACGTTVVPCEGQFNSHGLVLGSSLGTDEHTFYDGVRLKPPSPPPRG